MSDRDIRDWLQTLGLERYAQAFFDNDIDASALRLLDDGDLKILGVRSLGHRKKLLAAIAALNSGPNDSNDGGPKSNHDGNNDGCDQPTQLQRGGPASVLRAAEDPSGPMYQAGERRAVTVLFCDIVGFTEISDQRDPEETYWILEEYFEAVDSVVKRYGGHVDKHIGDAVMALFGAPIAHTNDPERAVRAAFEIREAIGQLRFPLRIHAGIASGSVVASGTGSRTHRAYTVTGSTVNLAARLQDIARADEILVSESVYREIYSWVDSDAMDEVSLKGLRDPVRIWRLRKLIAEVVPKQWATTPLIGRRNELERYAKLLAEVTADPAAPRGHLLCLCGEAGIGKSRLVAELSVRAQERGFAVHSGLLLDFGDGEDQSAIADLMASLLSVGRNASEEIRYGAAHSALREGTVSPHRDSYLYDLLDVPQPAATRARYDAMPNHNRRQGKCETLVEVVSARAATAPQLLIVEDLHWANAEVLDELSYLAQHLAHIPVLLVVTARPDNDPLSRLFAGDCADRIPHTVMELVPLRPEEALDLAQRWLHTNNKKLHAVVERAGGNPLFLEQLLRNAEEVAFDSLPDSIQGIVQARIDNLAPTDKQALQAASVLGQRFSLAALRHLCGDEQRSCTALIRHQLVRALEDDEYLFAHALVHEGVYASLLRSNRQALHARAAAFFAGRHLALWAEHLDRAGDPEADSAHLEAARGLIHDYRHEHALTLCRRGLAIARQRPVRRKSIEHAILCLMGDTLSALGDIDGALNVFTESDPLASSCDEHLRTWLGHARSLRLIGRTGEALAILDRAQPMAEANRAIAPLASIHHLRGNLLFPRGDLAGCRENHAKACDYARQAESPRLEANALSGLADAAMMAGDIRQARSHFDDCLDLCHRHRLLAVEPASLATRAYLLIFEGQLEDALGDAEVAASKAALLGDKRAQIIALGEVASLILIEMAQFGDAQRKLDSALDMVRELGIGRVQASLTRYAGVIQAETGNRKAGVALIETALEHSRRDDFAYMGPSILGALARYTDDDDARTRALAEGEAKLKEGTAYYNHIFFYRDAIEACLCVGDTAGMKRYATAIVEHGGTRPLPWAQFLADRAHLLARHLRGDHLAGHEQALEDLLHQSSTMHLCLGGRAIEVALEAIDETESKTTGTTSGLAQK